MDDAPLRRECACKYCTNSTAAMRIARCSERAAFGDNGPGPRDLEGKGGARCIVIPTGNQFRAGAFPQILEHKQQHTDAQGTNGHLHNQTTVCMTSPEARKTAARPQHFRVKRSFGHDRQGPALIYTSA
eukprot:3550137-Pyramimonas_sp.AAC.1